MPGRLQDVQPMQRTGRALDQRSKTLRKAGTMENWKKQQEKDGIPDVCPTCNDTGEYPGGRGYCMCQIGRDMEEAEPDPAPAWTLKTEGPCRNECFNCGARWDQPASGCPACHRSFCD